MDARKGVKTDALAGTRKKRAARPVDARKSAQIRNSHRATATVAEKIARAKLESSIAKSHAIAGMAHAQTRRSVLMCRV